MKSKGITKCIFVAALAWLVITILCGMRVHAADMNETNGTGVAEGVLKQLETDALLVTGRSDDADVALELKSGDYVFVTSEDDEWYEVYYQGDTLYMSKSVAVSEADISDEIDAELTGMQATNDAWIEEYQAQVEARRSVVIWRIILVALVVAFMAVTAYMTYKKPRTDNDDGYTGADSEDVLSETQSNQLPNT